MIVKKEMIAMLLAGGQGSRLGILTSNMAKPAVSFGGKYRIIDFPLSNCINSGVDTVGVLRMLESGFRGILIRMLAAFRYCLPMSRSAIRSGTQALRTRFIKTLHIWKASIPITC